MTENPQPEPDVATQLKEIGKKYMRFLSLSLDSVIQDLQPTPRAKKLPRARKQVAKPKPRTQNLGFSRWLKGPTVEERKDSSA